MGKEAPRWDKKRMCGFAVSHVLGSTSEMKRALNHSASLRIGLAGTIFLSRLPQPFANLIAFNVDQ